MCIRDVDSKCQLLWVHLIIVPFISRLVERAVVRCYLYPEFNRERINAILKEQYAFRPTGSNTAAVIVILHYDFKTASTIATSIVHSKLNYCKSATSSFSISTPPKYVQRLQLIQNSLAPCTGCYRNAQASS